MKHFFTLHHHKHTGRLLHHRHTSYGFLFLLLIVVGVFIVTLVGLERRAQADTILVSATVPAPIPSGAPTFTAPDDSTVTLGPTVIFIGTCPIITPAIIIALYDGSSLLGSAVCDSTGTFQLPVTLTNGSHTVEAIVKTITGQTGQSSAPLHVTYQAPVPEAPPSSTTTTPPSVPSTLPPVSPSPLINGSLIANVFDIAADMPFVLFRPGTTITWSGYIIGGQAPYTVRIAWGDGLSDSFSSTTGTVGQNHTYDKTGQYTLVVTISDAAGQSLSRSYAAVDGTPLTTRKFGQTVSAAFDNFSDDPSVRLLAVYTGVSFLLLVLWRYEFIHYRRRVGLPLHYAWQRAAKVAQPVHKHHA